MKKKKIIKLISLVTVSTNLSFISQNAYADKWTKSGDLWKYETYLGNTTGWEQIKGKWYYFNQNGNMHKGWFQDKGNWYYLNFDGDMCIGWKCINSQWYYFDHTGVMKSGWIKDNSKQYFMNNDGVMQTGLVKVDNKIYFLKQSGEMATGNVSINNKTYTFAKTGEAVGDMLPNVDKVFVTEAADNLKIINNGSSNSSDIINNSDDYGITAIKDEFVNEKSDGSTRSSSRKRRSSSSTSSSSSAANNQESQSGQGSQGEQGNQGGEGSQGEQGSQGGEGSQGGQGSQGGEGSQGEQGNYRSAPTGLSTTLSMPGEHEDDPPQRKGEICGLNPNEKYEYRLRSRNRNSQYIRVEPNSDKISNLDCGVYDVRFTTDAQVNCNKVYTVTVRNKHVFDDYFSDDDTISGDSIMEEAYTAEGTTENCQFSNDERIKNVIKRAEQGEDINILLVGGSITYGYSTRDYKPYHNESYGVQFAEWLDKVYPGQVTAYDIGIPSCGSPLENARIDTELKTYDPDIVFVDCAVNDGSSKWYDMHYDSLLRKILNYRKQPALFIPQF